MGIDLEFITGKSKKSERKNFSKSCFDETWKKQKGFCGICKEKMLPHTYEKDHKDGDNENFDCKNLWIIHRNCHGPKTYYQQLAKNAMKKKAKKKKGLLDIDLDI